MRLMERSKGLYIIETPIDFGNPSGVDKKVLGQVEQMKKSGLECKILSLSEEKGSHFKSLWNAILRRLPSTNVPKWNRREMPPCLDFIYIRKPSCITRRMLQVLNQMKSRNPGLRILLEIPTYPYDAEYMFRITDRMILARDRRNRKKLNEVIDRIVLVSNDSVKDLFGVRTINIINGIQFSDLAKRIPVVNDTIDLCCVASFNRWHGYERLLFGLAHYYRDGGQREIKIHFIGDGPELPLYRDIVESNQISDRVIFHGKKTGKELDHLYDVADFGVCSLAVYRKGIVVSSELKSREYLAKGLPLIAGCPIDIFGSEDFDFKIEFPNDSSVISMAEVIRYYDQLYRGKEEIGGLTDRIHDYGRRHADLGETMKPVIEYILSAKVDKW